jgi:DNA repair protein RadD
VQLRPYQDAAVRAIKDALSKKKDCLLTAPCAAGKTVIFSEIVKWLHAADRKCLVLLDRENLVTQTAARIRDYIGSPFDVGVACASVQAKKDVRRPIVVASRQTLAPMLRNGYGRLQFNLTILDEAHLVHPSRGQYKDILERLTENYPQMRLFGCTATPYRLSGGKIYGAGKLFSAIDFQITSEELLAGGYLVPLIWKIRQSDLNAQLDLVKKSSTGELNEREQAEILGQDIYVRGVYDTWREHAGDRKTAIFALNIRHAELIRMVFEEHGVSTWLIHSQMPSEQVKQAIAEYSASKGVMVNVGILTIGSDIPSISCVILARRTLSTSLFFQIVGRGSRLSPGKSDCLILDLCGNALIHGIDPDNPIRHEGGSNERRESSEPMIRICPMCESGCSLSTRICKQCGFEFPVEGKEPEEIEEAKDKPELVEFTGYKVFSCDLVRYSAYQGKGKILPTVKAEYYDGAIQIARQWLCPEHDGWPRKKSELYWKELGGGRPYPKTVKEWVDRSGELEAYLNLTVSFAGRYPEVKKVERIADTEGMPRFARSATA